MGYQKYKIVSELLNETMREVSSNEENWYRFLATSSRLYKYPFKEQVLIYAQRPDATACASVEIWNHRMNCWINRGAKGIALVDDDRRGKLKYVFDVSDVHKGRWRGRLPYLWDMKDVHQEVVLKRLEELYGKTDINDTIKMYKKYKIKMYNCYTVALEVDSMILKNNIITNLKINSLEDLYKLKPLTENSSLNINKSQIARELDVATRKSIFKNNTTNRGRVKQTVKHDF